MQSDGCDLNKQLHYSKTGYFILSPHLIKWRGYSYFGGFVSLNYSRHFVWFCIELFLEKSYL